MILQVLPIIIPHTSPIIIPHTSNDGSYANLPWLVEISLWVLLGLLLLATLVLLIKLIFYEN